MAEPSGFVNKETLITALSALVVLVGGAYIGVQDSRIEHTIARVDLHDQRFSTGDSRITISEHDIKGLLEFKTTTELRLREMESQIAKHRKE